MSPITKVSVVGASGRLGTFILKALQESSTGFDVTAITRHSSTATFDGNTKVLKVSDDYPDEEMVKAFRGQDAVVLSLGFAAEHRHAALARASIKAGVKHLIASGFGVDPANEAVRFFPVAKTKAAMVEDLKSIEQPGWAWTEISCGTFLDFCIKVNFYGINPAAKTADIWNPGHTTSFSASTRPAIAQAVAGVLTHPSKAINRSVFISSTELTLSELLAVEQKVSGSSDQDWTYRNIDTDAEIRRCEEVFATETQFMPKMMAAGRLGLAANLKSEFKADFAEQGLLENETFGVPKERLESIVAEVRRAT